MSQHTPPPDTTPSGCIRFEDRHLVRDMYIPLEATKENHETRLNEARMDLAYAYTGDPEAKRIYDGTDSRLTSWLINLYAESEASLEKRSNFRIEHDGTFFRAHRAENVQGIELALRAIPPVTPTLDQLNMPEYVRQLLLDPELLYGGLVLITASTGQGKTTTASATVKSRLEKYKGYAATVEDPPELPLQGWHGGGRCNQIPVTSPPGTMAGSGFAEALVNARRYYPSITSGGTMLMIGEIRNAETAAETLLAANEGHLVIATFHGSSVPNALMRIASMASDRIGVTQANELLAGTLKLCIFQNLIIQEQGEWWERGEVKAKVLSVGANDEPTKKLLQSANWGGITTHVAAQDLALKKLPANSALAEIKNHLRPKG
jgi:Tfp pilus assembly pilus retraction ATPase PilT